MHEAIFIPKRLTWYCFAALLRFKIFGTYDLYLQVTLCVAQRQLNLTEATGTEGLPPDHLARSKVLDEVSQLPFACHSQTRRPAAVFKIIYLAKTRNPLHFGILRKVREIWFDSKKKKKKTLEERKRRERTKKRPVLAVLIVRAMEIETVLYDFASFFFFFHSLART